MRTRLGAQTRSTQYTGTLDAFKKIWRADGVHGGVLPPPFREGD